MGEVLIRSKRFSLKKIFTILWIIIAILFLIILIFAGLDYQHYKKGQNLAINSTMAVTDKFDDYKNNRKELIKEMYEFYNPGYVNVRTSYGRYNNYSVASSATKADKSLGNLLSKAGYECYYGSEYLFYNSFLSYSFAHINNFVCIYIVLFLFAFLISILYILNKKKSILVKKDVIICKKISGRDVQFMINDIKSVETIFLKGLKIRGNGFNYRIFLVSNNEELKNEITNLLVKKNKETVGVADELIKFQKLLDAGIITKEEFENMKKEILS